MQTVGVLKYGMEHSAHNVPEYLVESLTMELKPKPHVLMCLRIYRINHTTQTKGAISQRYDARNQSWHLGGRAANMSFFTVHNMT